MELWLILTLRQSTMKLLNKQSMPVITVQPFLFITSVFPPQIRNIEKDELRIHVEIFANISVLTSLGLNLSLFVRHLSVVYGMCSGLFICL